MIAAGVGVGEGEGEGVGSIDDMGALAVLEAKLDDGVAEVDLGTRDELGLDVWLDINDEAIEGEEYDFVVEAVNDDW
jgi:hypothetical protein